MNFDETLMKRLKYLEREVDRLKVWEKPDNTGWIPVSATWTYASATTITVPSGAASIYSVGDKIKLNNTDTKYFYIVGVADTVLTITGGSDYTLDSDAISAVYYSKAATPLGFPQWFNYTPTITAQAGSFTTVSATGKFSMHGKDVSVNIIVTISANGTAATGVIATLPIPADADSAKKQLLYAREFAINGYMGFGYITNSANVVIRKYDNTYLGGDGWWPCAFGSYRAV